MSTEEELQKSQQSPESQKPVSLDNVFNIDMMERFEAGSYKNLMADFQNKLKEEPKHPGAWLGLAICYAANKKFSQSADIFLKLKQFSAGEAIKRFLPDRNLLWVPLIEQLLARGDVESSALLCKILVENWKPPSHIKNRLISLARRINAIQERGGKFSIGDHIWSFGVASSPVKVALTFLFIAGIIGFYVLLFGQETLSRYYLDQARSNYFRGVLLLVHLENSPPESSGSQSSAESGTAVLKTYLEKALEQCQMSINLDSTNFEARFLAVKCYRGLMSIEKDENKNLLIRAEIKRLKQEMNSLPGGEEKINEMDRIYQNYKADLINGNRQQL